MRPLRTCVGCRQRDDQSRLLRVVAGPAIPEGIAVLPDPRARLAGRGAWLHPTPECLATAIKRRAFGRALRLQGAYELSAVIDHVERQREE